MTRREFVVVSSLAPIAADMAAQDYPAKFDRPMRWAQLTLVEDDPGKYDPAFWLDYFKRVHADAACLSAGGCVAFYPTKIPFHHRSAWLGDRDSFGELFEGCRKMGMLVLARTDPHATYDDVERAHPDWIAVDAKGQRRRHWASPEMWVTCALGPYNFEFMTEVTREIASMYKVDGIFANRWSGSGMCYCEHCRANFRAHAGMDLPITGDRQDPARKKYVMWRQERLLELWKVWDAAIRQVNPEARFIANAGGGAEADIDTKIIGELAPTLFADRQARRGLATPWESGKNGKEYRSTLGRKAIGGIFSMGVEEPYRWKDSVQSGPEVRLWVADAVANGLRPWFTKFSGVLHDRRWLPVVEQIYTRYWQWERYLKNEAPLARVGLVYSQQTSWFYGGGRAARNEEDYIRGMYQALFEARIPFEMVHDRLLDSEHVGQFKLLLLPNVAGLSDVQCRQLRDFVKRGGSLLATLETSLYDEWGVMRANFGLADLFGVDYKSPIEGPMQNSYLTLEHATRHPILAGLGDAPRIINGVFRVGVAAREKFPNPPLTLVPSYPDLPMEKVYPRVAHTDTPEVYLREIGPSRIVYFPWDIDRVLWEVMSVDHARLLGNAIEWAANEERPATVTGPGMVDVTVWRQKDSITVHLVNLTNPMMMKGPVRELIPIGEQRVRVKLPDGKRAKKVQLLAAGRTPRVTESAGAIMVTVPSVLDHEVVAIDL